MWINYILIIFIGLCAGSVTACGYFALLTTVGVIPRYAAYTHTASKIRFYENALIAGAVIGNICFIFCKYMVNSIVIATVFSLAAGIFIGCFLVALAEAIKGFPVFCRRTGLRTGLPVILTAFAVGKGVGSLIFFWLYY